MPASPFEGSWKVDACRPEGPYTEVLPAPELETLRLYRDVGPDRDRASQLLALGSHTATELRFVVADAARGLRLVDAAPGKTARVSAALPLPSTPLYLHVESERALVALAREPGRHELWWIDLSVPSAPVVLDVHTEPGEFRGAHVVHAPGRPARVYAAVDRHPPEKPCGPRRDTVLLPLELGVHKLSAGPLLELGPTVSRVERAGPWLAVRDGFELDASSSLRIVEVGAPEPRLSEPRTIAGAIHALQADGTTLRWLWSKPETDDESHIQAFHLERLQAAAHGLAAPERDCVVRIVGPGKSTRILPPRLIQAVFARGKTLLRFSAGPARLVDEDSCSISEAELPHDPLIASPSGTQLVRVAEEGDASLRVSLLDPARVTHALAEASSTLPQPDQGSGAWRVYEVTAARVFEQASATLLAVPFRTDQAGQPWQRGSQLFSLTSSTLARGAQLESELWLAPATGPAVAIDESGLELLGLEDPRAPRSLARVPLWPAYLGGWMLPGGFARIRWGSERRPARETAPARLELVAQAADPEAQRAASSSPLSPEARLVRVGPTLVATTRHAQEGERPATCAIEVLSTRQARDGTRLARLEAPGAWCEDNVVLQALPHALAYVRPERSYKGRDPIVSRFAISVLELRDPSQPRWHGSFRTPAGELALRSFVRGSELVYAYRVASATSSRARAHHYLRAIQLSDPRRPVFGAPISVAGEVMALERDVAYARDAAWGELGPERSVRKLALRGQKASIVATYALPGRQVIGMAISDHATLLVQTSAVAPDVNVFVPADPQITVLDASSLTSRGDVPSNDTAQLAAASAGVALYNTYGEVHVIDHRGPEPPRLARVLQGSAVTDAQGSRALLLQEGALRAVAITELAAPEPAGPVTP